MNFEKDILISYAHIDDESVRGDGEGWITEFHRSLEIRLAQLLGEKPKIWRDQKLQGNDYFADEIVEQFPNIALLVSILSPRYVNSEWCNKEVNEFVKVARENIGLRVKNKSRIFKVIKTPIALEQHPEPVRDLLGYEFFKLDHDTGRAKEFGKLFGSDMEEAYWTRLNDLAYDIVALLSEMRSMSSDKEATAEGEEKPIVYLSQSSYDLKEFRENIKRELNENGYHVVPDHHLPTVAPELEVDVKSMLKASQLAIHLVGGNYGLIPEGADKSIIALQNEIAAEHTKESDMERVIWFVPNSGVDDPRQELFIENLHNSAELQRGAEVIESSLEDVKHTVLTKLKRMEEAARKAKEQAEGGAAEEANAEAASADGPKAVYLICDQEDLDGIMDLEDYLFDQGFNVIIPVFDGDESDVRLDHQENLKTCDACLIYYGAGNELWMRAKQRDLMKIAGYGREKPLSVSAVYMAPPANPRKERFRALNTIVINGSAGFSDNIMSEFVEKLNNG